jgi:hypothetical protein
MFGNIFDISEMAYSCKYLQGSEEDTSHSLVDEHHQGHTEGNSAKLGGIDSKLCYCLGAGTILAHNNLRSVNVIPQNLGQVELNK